MMKPFRGNCTAQLSWWVAVLLITAHIGNAFAKESGEEGKLIANQL